MNPARHFGRLSRPLGPASPRARRMVGYFTRDESELGSLFQGCNPLSQRSTDTPSACTHSPARFTNLSCWLRSLVFQVIVSRLLLVISLSCDEKVVSP
jgi:hypothetical protein